MRTGVTPYFSFRSKSEQERRNDPEWVNSAYHDDLLAQALSLVHKEPRNPKQASLRRAVSAAYYALFHLLISEAVANWNRVNLRAALGRRSITVL